jgi:hypothetical protein
LALYAKHETPKRAESAQKVEKIRLEKTIPNVKLFVGRRKKT